MAFAPVSPFKSSDVLFAVQGNAALEVHVLTDSGVAGTALWSAICVARMVVRSRDLPNCSANTREPAQKSGNGTYLSCYAPATMSLQLEVDSVLDPSILPAFAPPFASTPN